MVVIAATDAVIPLTYLSVVLKYKPVFTSIDAVFSTHSVGSFLHYKLSTGVKIEHLKRIVFQSLVARSGNIDLALKLMFG